MQSQRGSDREVRSRRANSQSVPLQPDFGGIQKPSRNKGVQFRQRVSTALRLLHSVTSASSLKKKGTSLSFSRPPLSNTQPSTSSSKATKKRKPRTESTRSQIKNETTYLNCDAPWVNMAWASTVPGESKRLPCEVLALYAAGQYDDCGVAQVIIRAAAHKSPPKGSDPCKQHVSIELRTTNDEFVNCHIPVESDAFAKINQGDAKCLEDIKPQFFKNSDKLPRHGDLTTTWMDAPITVDGILRGLQNKWFCKAEILD